MSSLVAKLMNSAQWNGSGVDPDLVDPEMLRNIWLSDQPDGGTMVLMQQAWLASQQANASAQGADRSSPSL